MIYLSYSVHDEEAQAFFDYAGYKTRDMREPFEDVLHFVRAFEAEVFASEGDIIGGWAPLDMEYQAYKERVRPGKSKLKFNDHLWLTAITAGQAHMNSMSYIVRAENKRGFDYGEAHMEGTERMPPRPWFAWTVEHDAYMEFAFSRWLDELRTANMRRGNVGDAVRPSAPNLSHVYEGAII